MSRPPHQSYRRYPLTWMLGNTGHVRLLRALVGHGAPRSSVQLAADAGLTPQGARRVLEELAVQRAVEILGSGRARLFGPRTSHAAVIALTQAFDAERSQWVQFLESLRQTVAVLPGVLDAWLYGSVARGDDRPESDVDVALLAASTDVDAIVRERLSELERPLDARFSIITLVREDLSSVQTSWWREVSRDAIVLKGRRPEDARPPVTS